VHLVQCPDQANWRLFHLHRLWSHNLMLNKLAAETFAAMEAQGFWDGHLDNNLSKIALMHTELSEVVEALRNDPNPSAIWYRGDGKPEGVRFELADVIIRIADFAGRHTLDLEASIEEKAKFNATRPFRHGKAA